MESRTFVNLGHSDYLVNSIHKLYESTSLCDVTLRTQDGDNIKAHWLILVAHSEYFECLYTSRDDQSDIVCLDTDSNTLRKVLEYLYTGKITFTEECRKQLVDTGQLFKLPSLVNLCSKKQTTSCYKSNAESSQSKQENDGSHSVFVPESQTCESDEFDANRVKEELEEEDSELHVTFTSEMCNQAERRVQSESDLLKEGPEQVKIMHIVQNVAVQKDKQTLGQKSSEPSEAFSTEEAMEDSDFPGFSDPNIEFIGVREKRKRKSVSKAAKSKRKTHSEFAAKILIVRNESDQREGKESNDLSMTGKDEECGSVEGDVISRRCEQNEDSNSNSLPDSDDAKESSSHLSPSARKKPRKISKPVKIRAGNFLTRWNKTSICSLCGFEGQIHAVVLHKKSVHPEDAHVCPLCFNRSVDHGAMVQHLKRQHLWRESGRYRCLKCGRDCHNRVGQLSHDQIVHGIRHKEVLVCETEGCNFYCASQSPATMEEHRKGHGDTFHYPCDRCHKKYKTKKALKNHQYQHTNSHRYQCEVCGYFTATPSDLRIHNTTNHSDGPQFHCHICGNNYRSQYSMDDHLWKVHGEKEAKRRCLQCDECDFITLWQGTLTAHKKIHVTEKNYACEICGKIFRTPNNLSSHRNSTHKECDLHCNFSFCQHTTKTLDHMRKHLMIAHYYKGVKPYSCVYCPYKSMTGGNVRKHVMVQHPTEEVKYVPDRTILAEMRAKWVSLDKTQWTDVLRNK